LDSTQEIYSQRLNLSLNLKESIPLLQHFITDIHTDKGKTVSLSLDKGLLVSLSLDQLKKTSHISVEIPQLDIKLDKNKHQINNLTVVNQQNGKIFNLGINCDSYFAKQTDSVPYIRKFDFQAAVADNVIDFFATAEGNEKTKIQDVLLEGSVKFLDMKKMEMEVVLNNGSIVWDKERFLFDASNYVYLAKDSIFIRNFGLHAQSGKSIAIHSGKTERDENAILFNFNKINLGLLNVLLNRYQISLQGEVTGKGGLVRNAYGYALGSNFEIDDFQFNNVEIGFFKGRTYWNNIEKKLFLQTSVFETKDDVSSSLLTISGSFDPKEKYINLVGKVDSLNVKVLEPYLRSFASRVEGFGTGEVSLKGKISDPKLTGSIALKKAVLGIDFLKTDYFIEKGTIDFVDTGFILNNISCRDAHNGKGTVNGIITHKRLRDFGVNLKINAANLLVLNTSMKDNNLFYGKAFATGTASISGKVNDALTIDADVTTNPATDITLSLDWNITVKESDFIRFVSFEVEKEKTETPIEKPKSTAMLVNLRITATPDAIVRVLLDPTIGGTIVSRGSGSIEMVLDKNNNFNMYGPYTLSSGDFNIALGAVGGVLTRSFKLESGGTISWNGDPTQGTVNARAIQTTRVSLGDINGVTETSKHKPVLVNNILSLNGRLLNPDMSFTFTLPDADEMTKAKIYSDYDTKNREEMIKQLVNVLLLGRFEMSNGNTIPLSNDMYLYSVGELISAQVNKFLSNISDNLDIRATYRPGENTIENEYGLDFSGRFLNDRLILQSSFGFPEQQNVDAQNQFLRDFSIEWILIPDGSLRVKAFNTANPQDVLSSYSSVYSQGGGFTYIKEFDTVKELFTRKNKKKKKNPQKQPIGLPEEEE
jgi:hypothetical protein